MKLQKLIAGAALALTVHTASVATAQTQVENNARGDYIESRSASVYAGPCHYSNEAVTEGRTATLAWRFTDGTWNNVELKGLKAVAVLMADTNLATDKNRSSVLYLEAKASAQQTAALRALFAEKYRSVLGKIVAVKAADVQVSNDGLDYRVRVGNVVNLNVNRYPCKHCTQDAQIWYQPFASAQDIIVGKTTRSSFNDATLGQAWDDRQEANSAFVGTFTITG